ncbi:hypothetical protein KY290_004777 [Solanum tuberosum]|uniref:NB-ARC domain-containing protein n=1 Tax=Solanum tuberosum TaxID=4113 RepID=A0ABQ7WE89_SOLTU|nr:hypothetical protein KY284_004885 [Solanum tuberosum]KAH0778350.1 hypothetical protein KY290_004777 [Solanum tuberosum]
MAHDVVVSLQQKLQEMLVEKKFWFLPEVVTIWRAFLEDSLSKQNAPEAVEHLESRVKYLATQLLDSINLYELEKRSPDFNPVGMKVFQDEVVTAASYSIEEYMMKVMNGPNDIDALSTWNTVESDSKYTPHLQATVLGLDNDLMTIKSRLIGPPSKLDVVSIVGMGGIGKTTLARKVYDDIYMERHFYIRAWITCFSLVNANTYLKSTEQLAEQVYRSLKGRRYLIAMDDVWDNNAWDDMKRSFPDDKNGSRVILTTRLANVGIYASSGSLPYYMRCLSVEQSLELFNSKVFGRETCPPELEKAIKQVVEKCQGLPLAIVVVAGFCSKISKTKNCWEDVAHKIGLVVSRDTKECLDLLALSYNHLPHHLKSCFLYMGAFPKNIEISVSRLIKQWIAAMFVNCTPEKDFEEVSEGYLRDLIDRSLIMVKKMTSSGKVKTCEVHDLLYDIIVRESQKERFIYFTKSNVIVSPSVASFEYCIIFNYWKDLWTHLDLDYDIVIPSLPWANSFLCFGRDGTTGFCHQIDSFITFTNFTILAVLDLCFQPFDHLPSEIWKLYSLRYLALASFDVLPPSKLVLMKHLEALKCFFINPWTLQQCVVFSPTLEKLTLRGCQLPWNQMTLLCKLPKLEVLKLKYYAFQGSKWEPTDERFQQLKYLLLDGTDLMHWKATSIQFPKLENLVLKNCGCLYEIPDDVAEIPTLLFIELYHCSSSADDSANRIREEQISMGNDDLVVRIHKFPNLH